MWLGTCIHNIAVDNNVHSNRSRELISESIINLLNQTVLRERTHTYLACIIFRQGRLYHAQGHITHYRQ